MMISLLILDKKLACHSLRYRFRTSSTADNIENCDGFLTASGTCRIIVSQYFSE